MGLSHDTGPALKACPSFLLQLLARKLQQPAQILEGQRRDCCWAVQNPGCDLPHSASCASPGKGRPCGSELTGTIHTGSSRAGSCLEWPLNVRFRAFAGLVLLCGAAGIPACWLSQGQGCQPLTPLSPALCNMSRTWLLHSHFPLAKMYPCAGSSFWDRWGMLLKIIWKAKRAKLLCHDVSE